MAHGAGSEGYVVGKRSNHTLCVVVASPLKGESGSGLAGVSVRREGVGFNTRVLPREKGREGSPTPSVLTRQLACSSDG
jgi:hypothetical protein